MGVLSGRCRAVALEKNRAKWQDRRRLFGRVFIQTGLRRKRKEKRVSRIRIFGSPSTETLEARVYLRLHQGFQRLCRLFFDKVFIPEHQPIRACPGMHRGTHQARKREASGITPILLELLKETLDQVALLGKGPVARHGSLFVLGGIQ